MARLAIAILLLLPQPEVQAQAPASGKAIEAGSGVLLGEVAPELKSLKKNDLTLEFWIRPDPATVARQRALLWLFSNQRGSDVAGIGMSLAAGKLQANVLGTKLSAPGLLAADEWTHACLTIQSRTLNKVATLWVNGRRVDRGLAPYRWPTGFFYTRLMTDPWSQGRFFSGQAGPIRITSGILYQQDFVPTSDWKASEKTLLLLQPDQIQPKR